jgi:hypothetical protein
MPSRRRLNQQDHASSTPAPTASCSETFADPVAISMCQMKLKDIMTIMPPFSSPARIWAQKVKLIWPTANNAPTHLIEVIKLRLPPALFDALTESNFQSHLALLDKVTALDDPTTSQAAVSLFEFKAQIQPHQLPREYFSEMKRSIQTVFPEYPQDIVNSMAWQKLRMALPPSMQVTLSLLANQNVNEQVLETIDKAWRLLPTSTCASANATPSNTTLDVMTQVMERLERLEAKLEPTEDTVAATMTRSNISANYNRPKPHSSFEQRQMRRFNNNWCYYHNKFGSQAFNCAQPCSFTRKPLN